MVYCELCGSPTHTTKQCHALDALADRLDRSAFRVDKAPQGFGGGHRGRGRISRWMDLVEEDQFIVTIVMNKDTSQEIVLFREDLGVHTAETTPMPPRISLN
jgi:hypothetical protein